jgi:protein-L-isoaspartate O-methyltransferase
MSEPPAPEEEEDDDEEETNTAAMNQLAGMASASTPEPPPAPEEEEDDDEEETNTAAMNQLAGMAPAELLALFAQFAMHHRAPSAATNQELIEMLEKKGELTSPAVIRAFLSVDRKTYCVGADDEDAYADRPYRSPQRIPNGTAVPRAIHLSAPGIYARCIEHLDLKPGLSFLNVGSGTGYLSAVVASLIGPHAIHHGIELRTSLVELSRTLAAERGLSSIVFHNRSFRAVDPKASMKFDRIWLGAASNAEERTLAAQLLKIGGLCVGPFECESGEQHLSKLERCGAHELLTPADRESELPIRLCWAGDVRVRQTRYLRVSFSPLLRELRELRDVAHDVLAEPHEPLVLRAPVWGSSVPAAFPPSFLHTAAILFLGVTRDVGSLCAKIPWDLWTMHVLPHVPHDAFEPDEPPETAAWQSRRRPSSGGAMAWAGNPWAGDFYAYPMRAEGEGSGDGDESSAVAEGSSAAGTVGAAAGAAEEMPARACLQCAAPLSCFRCPRCRSVDYCSAACARVHWPEHRNKCSSRPPSRGAFAATSAVTGTSVVTGTSAAPAAGADGEGALSSAVTDLTAQLGAASNSASTAAEHAAAAAAASAFASQAAVAAVAAVTAEEP